MVQKVDQKMPRKILKWVPLILFIVVPYTSILLAREHELVGRIVALSIVFCSAVVLIFWYSLNPKTKIIRPGGKLTQLGFKKKQIVEWTARLLFLGFGLVFLYSFVVPFAIDMFVVVQGYEITTVKGTVTRNSTLFGTWFLSQSIRINRGTSGEETYYLLYSLKPRLRRETKHEFLILPHSKLILEAKELKKTDIW